MKLLLLTVGKPRHPLLDRVHDDYATRIRRFRIDYDHRFVPETKPSGRLDDRHVRDREAKTLLAALPREGTVVALDPAGTVLDSEGLARRLERWAAPGAVFVLGGPLGLGAPLLERADFRWSLSRLTFPHELARVLVAEQLYRGITLIRGVPYHK